MKKELKNLESLLKEAGGEVMRFFRGSDLSVSQKQDASLVTEADLASESLIISKIKSQYPSDKIYSEEAGLSSEDRTAGTYIWIIDPLDGTTNFANNYPFFCISIARGQFLENGNIRVVLGGIYDPCRDECYLAAAGEGATCNGTPMKVQNDRAPEQTFLVTGFSYNKGEELKRDVDRYLRIAETCLSIRRDGAAALDLAYVARGIYDGYWDNGLRPWDIAAGSLLVLEAGGHVFNPSASDNVFHTESEDILCGSRSATEYLLSKM